MLDHLIFLARLVVARVFIVSTVALGTVYAVLLAIPWDWISVPPRAKSLIWYQEIFFWEPDWFLGGAALCLILAILLAYGQKEEKRKREARARVAAVRSRDTAA
jgi:hypothetical protein